MEKHVALHVTYRCSCQMLSKLEFFWTDFLKTSKNRNFMKILAAGAELFQADGQTGMTKPIVAFRNFVNAPNLTIIPLTVLTN
jgi:hypothetical protein